jgi:hypothetical protein
MIVFWFTGFVFEKEMTFPDMEVFHEGDITADLNGTLVTKVLLEHFNPLPVSNSIFIPLAEYMTLDQIPDDCVDENLTCVKSEECEDLPDIFTPPLDEASTCEVIYKTQKTAKKGCRVHAWCPRQNPNKKHTTWIVYKEALNIILITNCDNCGEDETPEIKLKYSKITEFPAKGANVFRLNELLKASGLDLEQVRSIGTSINLWKKRVCFRLLFWFSCSDELHLYPMEYYGQSLGYSEMRTNNMRMFKEKRNEHQVIGVNLNFDMSLEVNDFSFLRLGLFFAFFYLLDNMYKKIIFIKQSKR